MDNKEKKLIKDLTLIVVLAAILFVQQLALSFIPNVQFSVLLVVLYTKTIGFKKTSLIILIHVILSSTISPFGALNIVLLPAMWLAWMLIPIILKTVLRKVESSIYLSIFGLIYGFLYGWVFIPFTVWLLDTPFIPYLIMDIPFEIIMAITNMITILWLYDPLKKALLTQIDINKL